LKTLQIVCMIDISNNYFENRCYLYVILGKRHYGSNFLCLLNRSVCPGGFGLLKVQEGLRFRARTVPDANYFPLGTPSSLLNQVICRIRSTRQVQKLCVPIVYLHQGQLTIQINREKGRPQPVVVGQLLKSC